MSYHAEFSDGHGGQVASNAGWHEFCRYVRSGHDDELAHLCEHGWSDDLDALRDALLGDVDDESPEDVRSVADGLLEQLADHIDADHVVITDGSTDEPEDEDEDDTSQHDEMSDYLARLREVVGKGHEAAAKRVRDLADSLPTQATATSLPDLGAMIERQVEALKPLLGYDLTADTLPASVRGVLEVLGRLSKPHAEANPYGGTVVRPRADLWYREVAKADPDETHPAQEVLLPAVHEAANALERAPVVARRDYLETARAVREGAFAVTGDLTDAAVRDVRDQVVKAVAEGTTLDEFRDRLSRRLGEEGSPLSPARLENVFRTNVLSAYSQGKWDATTKDPVVSDAFPYARYFATHDGRVRPEHLQLETAGLDGTNVYRVDDPTFQKFRPPWTYQCRCRWSPCTVEQAAGRGVKEAQSWLDRAKEMAKDLGGHYAQYLSQVAPSASEHVTAPPFEPPEGFTRA